MSPAAPNIFNGRHAFPLPKDAPCNTVARKTNGIPTARINKYGLAALSNAVFVLGIPAIFNNGSQYRNNPRLTIVPNATANKLALLTTT
jgi:hypothetical protein